MLRSSVGLLDGRASLQECARKSAGVIQVILKSTGATCISIPFHSNGCDIQQHTTVADWGLDDPTSVPATAEHTP
jgi:hypothetical protein